MSRLVSPSLLHLLASSAQALRRAPRSDPARRDPRLMVGTAVEHAERQRRDWQDGLSAAVLLALAFAVWQALPEDAAAGDLLSMRLCLAAAAGFGLRIVVRAQS